MITNVRLTNFRGFETEVNIRIRPITVLIGRNSAGKSSLIKFLLMLRQTLESQRDEFFVTDGRYVQLGSWVGLKNAKSRSRAFEFNVEINTSDVPSAMVQHLWSAMEKKGVVSETGSKIHLSMDIAEVPVSRVTPSAVFSVSGRIRYAKHIRYGQHGVRGKINDREVFAKRANNLGSTSFLRFGRSTDSVKELIQSVAIEQFLDRLRHEFTSIRHLSPVREESLRTVQTTNPPPRDVGDRGEHAITHLVRILSDSSLEDDARFVGRFADQVAEVDAISIRSRIASLATQVKAQNQRTGAVNYLADFGFGVSQCLPIFVQGVLQERGQLLVVEQPESQLHPTAQLELGGFFAALWTERQVPSIIETHSANLLLRIRKLIKKEELKSSDVSVAYFTVEDRKVVVRNLDIHADGSLEKGLPMEFFGADVIEAIEMGA